MKHFLSQATFAFIRVLNMPFFGLARLTKSNYQVIIPANTYAPWHSDENYRKLMRAVKKNSLVNFYQGYELWKLAEQMNKVPGDFLEVGVWRGSSTIIMGTKLQQIGSSKTIFSCDTFEGVVKSNPDHDNFYKDGEHSDTSLEFVQNLVEKDFGLRNVKLLKGIFPDDTQHLIADRTFAMCHIDVDTYDSAVGVMNWLWPRLEKGGVIVFNDYGFPMTQGITKLVNEYAKDSGRVVLHNLNGHGIIVKTD